MKIRLPLLIVLLALAGLVLSACGPQATPEPAAQPDASSASADTAATSPTEETVAEPTAEPTLPPQRSADEVTITDGLGRDVTIAANPQRIVSLAASVTEIVFAVGAGDRLVGRDEFSDYPPEALDVESIGSLFPNVNAEAVVALQPDLVIAAGITNPDDVNALAQLGLNVFATRFDVTIQDIYADILDVGELTGQSEAAEEVVGDMQARMQAVQNATGAAERPVVFYEIDATEPSKPWTAGTGTFIDTLIEMAGGENAGGSASDYFQISLEELVAQDPQIIVLGSSTFGGQTPELVAAREGWGDIAAVQDGAIYTFDDNLVSRPGPRIVDGLEALARIIHPDLFE